jgi:DNA-binding Xre family transcriptional regulator
LKDLFEVLFNTACLVNKIFDVKGYQLAKQTGINYQIIDNYYKNKVVRYDSDVLDRICKALHCRIEDILTFEEN